MAKLAITPSMSVSQGQSTALHFAARHGHAQLVQVLLPKLKLLGETVIDNLDKARP